MEMFGNEDWDFLGADTQYLTHNFHPFAAKFIPQIPARIIREHTRQNDWVLDPFVGCGTTLVECKLLGRNAVGVDINPLFSLITKVKSTPISSQALDALKSWQDRVLSDINSNYGQAMLSQELMGKHKIAVPHYSNIDHWFARHVQQELAIIKKHVDGIGDRDLRDFLLVCLSSIIVRVSYQDSETRYARKEKTIKSMETYQAFKEKLEDMVLRMKEFSRRCTSSVIQTYTHDSRHLEFFSDDSFDLIVTSPPYVNAYDYHKYHRQRMYWLGVDPTPVRRSEIGGHDTYTKTDADPETYFVDLSKCLQEMHRLLKPDAFCFIVIGEGIVKGVVIPSHKRIAELGQRVGFHFQHIITRNIDKTSKSFGCGARIEQEHIVILKKS